MTAPETTEVCPYCGGMHAEAGAVCPLSRQETVAYTLPDPAEEPEPKATAADEIGKEIGRFRLQAFLGAGGFASVFRAEDTRLGRQVAIKLLHPQLAADQAFVRRFNAEARAAARLRHQHIVATYEVGETPEGRPYLVMALIEGTPLSQIIVERAPLPYEQSAAILSELALALDYVHSQGLVHRDIKPSNVMISDAGDVTLMDFGIARALDEQAYLTRTGQLIGTPVYMAPEQIEGTEVGPAADRYSLGILAYEMLAGRPPFIGTITSVIRNQLDTPPPPLAGFNPAVPEAACEAIERQLAKDPNDRPATAMEFVRLFRGEAVPGQPRTRIASRPALDPDRPDSSAPTVSDDGAAVPRRVSEGRMSRRLPRAIAAGAVGVVLALVAWLFLAGPLAGGDGSLSVTSDPAGASVTVDGRKLGVTPLAAQKLSPGVHSVAIEKPTYLTVTRQEKIDSRQTDKVNAVLSSLPPSGLLDVNNVFTALSTGADAAGACRAGEHVAQVRVEQPFCMVVNLVQKYPGERDLIFEYQFVLADASGTSLQHSESVRTTMNKSEAERPITWTYTFPAAAGDVAPTTAYLLRFYLNGNPVGSSQIALVP